MSSVEALLISAIVDEGAGALRQVYTQGVSRSSFALYDEEFEWLEKRMARRRPITRRTFLERFADFEFARSKGETIPDLARELKEENALARSNEILNTLAMATKETILDALSAAREEFSILLRTHAPMGDVDLDAYEIVKEEMRQRRTLLAQGIRPGLTTGVPHVDHHMGGLLPGQFIQLNGRTGSAKSYFTMMLAWRPRKEGAIVGVFSPEFNAHEVRCRYHTLASCDKDVQRECGLERSFRNRALMDGEGFNFKSYERMLEYIDSIPGRMHLLCATGRTDKMSVGYVEDRIVELGLDLVVIDPIYLLKPVRLAHDGNPYQEVAWIAEQVQQLGETYNIPIVFTNQAHLDGNKGEAPDMDKSWGSKQLLHMADYVLAVQHISQENTLKVRSNKSRFGAGGWKFNAKFLPNTGYFEVTTPLDGSYLNGRDDGEKERVKKAFIPKVTA